MLVYKIMFKDNNTERKNYFRLKILNMYYEMIWTLQHFFQVIKGAK